MLASPVAILTAAQRATAAQLGSDDDALTGPDGSVYLYGNTEHRVTRWLVDVAGNVVETTSFRRRVDDESLQAA